MNELKEESRVKTQGRCFCQFPPGAPESICCAPRGGARGAPEYRLCRTGATIRLGAALPWPWIPLDPMDAGTRAYQNYLKNKG